MRLLISSLLFLFSFTLLSQQKCGTTIKEDLLKEKYPQYKSSREVVNYETNKWLINNCTDNLKSIITIPVVVHVVYNTNAENISDAQIFSQMDVLNADFRRTNLMRQTHHLFGKTLQQIVKLIFVWQLLILTEIQLLELQELILIKHLFQLVVIMLNILQLEGLIPGLKMII